jgi:hypothetical protein
MSMSNGQICRRYPRLLRAMMWVAVLSPGEAIGAIQGYQETPKREYTSEAVGAYLGGWPSISRRTSGGHDGRRLSGLSGAPSS